MMFKRFFEVRIISKKEEAAIEYLDKIKFFYQNLPELFKQMRPLYKNPTNLQFILKDLEKDEPGSKAIAESSNPQAGRSATLNLLIMDEAAFMADAKSIWTAAKWTLLKSKGQAIIISTANGYGNFFENMWAATVAGKNRFNHYFIQWDADPEMTKELYDELESSAEAEGQLREFRQEMPRNANEAFIVSGNTFFDPDLIEKYLKKTLPSYKVGNITKVAATITHPPRLQFVNNANGFIKIWEFPKQNVQYASGVDTAEGIQSGDFSVCTVYDRETGKQVAEYSGHINTDSFAKDIYSFGEYYNFMLLNIEMNSIGESLMNYLVKQRHYPNIYRQMRYDERSNKKIKKLGWKTTNTSKRLMLDALNTLLINHEIEPYSETLFHEMKKFMLEKTKSNNYVFSAANGNDDHVISHALAAVILQTMPFQKSIRRQVVPQQQRKKLTQNVRRGKMKQNIKKIFK